MVRQNPIGGKQPLADNPFQLSLSALPKSCAVALQIARAFGAQVFATVSPEKKNIVGELGAVPIDYRSTRVEEYVTAYTEGKGFDIVYDTVGGATLDASFDAVKRYTGHVLSCLGWGAHSLAPLSFRGATYSACLRYIR